MKRVCALFVALMILNSCGANQFGGNNTAPATQTFVLQEESLNTFNAKANITKDDTAPEWPALMADADGAIIPEWAIADEYFYFASDHQLYRIILGTDSVEPLFPAISVDSFCIKDNYLYYVKHNAYEGWALYNLDDVPIIFRVSLDNNRSEEPECLIFHKDLISSGANLESNAITGLCFWGEYLGFWETFDTYAYSLANKEVFCVAKDVHSVAFFEDQFFCSSREGYMLSVLGIDSNGTVSSRTLSLSGIICDGFFAAANKLYFTQRFPARLWEYTQKGNKVIADFSVSGENRLHVCVVGDTVFYHAENGKLYAYSQSLAKGKLVFSNETFRDCSSMFFVFGEQVLYNIDGIFRVSELNVAA